MSAGSNVDASSKTRIDRLDDRPVDDSASEASIEVLLLEETLTSMQTKNRALNLSIEEHRASISKVLTI